MAKTPEAQVVSLARFRRDRTSSEELVPERGDAPAPPALPLMRGFTIKPPVDLTGRPTVWCLLGSGGAGKTVEARFLYEHARLAGSDLLMTALDPGTRSLAAWFDGVEQPETRDTKGVARWLRDYLDYLVTAKGHALLDFGGGGETALAELLASTPGIAEHLWDAGMAMVACYVLTPRIDDVFIIKRLTDAGFQPSATMLLMNEGKGDQTRPVSEVFDAIVSHSVFRGAIERGAQVVWMPALDSEVLAEIEKKGLPFGAARDGQVPKGATFHPIGGLRRAAIGRWLSLTSQRHDPVKSWMA